MNETQNTDDTKMSEASARKAWNAPRISEIPMRDVGTFSQTPPPLPSRPS